MEFGRPAVLAQHLAQDPGTDCRLGETVLDAHFDSAGAQVHTQRGGHTPTLSADALVMAMPGNRVSGLMPTLDVVEAVPELQGTRVTGRFVSRQPAAICKRPKGCVRSIQRVQALGALPRVAFCGDCLSNSTVGQSHWSGMVAAGGLKQRLA